MRQLSRASSGEKKNSRRDPNILVGADALDDAGVYRLGLGRALVQTVDFFTPIVDDPFAFGRIAAANALSDVYAMGGRPLTALNLLGVPTDRLPPAVIARILRGGARTVREAGCALVGGHTIRNPEPIYGLSVTGLVDPRRMLTNAAARPGDLLVLTKPLGTGIATTAIKRGLATSALARKAVASMARLNTVGADLAEARLVRAATDVTGFGLLGHLASMCRASGVAAEIDAQAVPVLSQEIRTLAESGCVPGGSKQNLTTARPLLRHDKGATAAGLSILADAQTSGGLLLCVPPKRQAAMLAMLKEHRTLCAAIIGRVVRSAEVFLQVRS